jgi:DNA-binding SARP family transcriptional activator
VEVRILGPFEVVSGTAPITIPGAKCRALLAMLAANTGRVVASERLIDDLWEQRPPDSAAATLQTYVYQLRRAVPPDAIVTRSRGYALGAGVAAVDAEQFEGAIRHAATADFRRAPRRVVSELAGALALWRGQALEDFRSASWAQPVIARLEEMRLATVERCNAARLELGEHRELVPDLESLVDQHPLRESLCAQLMLALYRAERQADALRKYASLRRRLRDELGIDPSRELVQLEDAILLQKPELDWVPTDHAYASEALSMTGVQALADLAPDVAADAFERALAVIDEQTRPYDVRRAEALVGLGAAQHQRGDRRASTTLLDAARLAQRVREPDLLIRASLATNRRSARKTGAVDDAYVQLLEASLATEGGAAPSERASLFALLAAELTWVDRDRAVSLSDEALELARRSGDDRRLWEVLATRQQVIWAPSTLAERRANALEQWDVADRIGDPALRWSAIANLANTAVCAGDIAEADRLNGLVVEFCESTGLPPHRALVARYRGWRWLLAGDVARAEQAAEEAFALLDASHDTDAALTRASQMLEIRRAQARLEEFVEPMLRRERADRAAHRLHLAAALCEIDRTAEAQELFRPLACDAFAALPFDITWLPAMSAAADVARALNDRDAATVIAAALEPWRDQYVYTAVTCRGSIERALGVALAAAGRPAEASDAFARASERHAAVAAPIELARTQVDWARTIMSPGAPGDRERARTLLHEAAATARELRLPTIERDARRALTGLAP